MLIIRLISNNNSFIIFSVIIIVLFLRVRRPTARFLELQDGSL